ncbi:MAG: SRPBCC family protein [Deltaproteobacteria bacterium]|nr:SRPBCC family protein [Deltaproteobacteria bacterium]
MLVMVNDHSRRLRLALLANATVSSMCAIGLLGWAPDLETHIPLPASAQYGLAAGLLVFVTWLVWQATRPAVDLRDALSTSLADGLWVLGSAIIWGWWSDASSPLGAALFLGVAGAVGLVGGLQLAGIGYAIAERDPSLGTRNRHALTVDVDAPPDSMWKVIADLPGIHRYAPDITSSTMRTADAPGLGAVRACTNARGQRWAEQCTDWVPGERIALRFLANEPGFPFPMNPMLGGWVVQGSGRDRARVTVWWSFTTKPAWAGVFIVPLMAGSLRRSFIPVIQAMAAQARRHAAAESTPADHAA